MYRIRASHIILTCVYYIAVKTVIILFSNSSLFSDKNNVYDSNIVAKIKNSSSNNNNNT